MAYTHHLGTMVGVSTLLLATTLGGDIPLTLGMIGTGIYATIRGIMIGGMVAIIHTMATTHTTATIHTHPSLRAHHITDHVLMLNLAIVLSRALVHRRADHSRT